MSSEKREWYSLTLKGQNPNSNKKISIGDDGVHTNVMVKVHFSVMEVNGRRVIKCDPNALSRYDMSFTELLGFRETPDAVLSNDDKETLETIASYLLQIEAKSNS